MTSSKDEISGRLLVNGAATDASASDSDIPISAVFSAGASFAPSPVNPLSKLGFKRRVSTMETNQTYTVYPKLWRR
jgi:hypothetical protein